MTQNLIAGPHPAKAGRAGFGSMGLGEKSLGIFSLTFPLSSDNKGKR